jgi:hypothetical protein
MTRISLVGSKEAMSGESLPAEKRSQKESFPCTVTRLGTSGKFAELAGNVVPPTGERVA